VGVVARQRRWKGCMMSDGEEVIFWVIVILVISITIVVICDVMTLFLVVLGGRGRGDNVIEKASW